MLPPWPPTPARYGPLVLMHMMPWFDLGQQNTQWTAQLWEQDGLYLWDRYADRGRVAAHYTPLIGPYDSADVATIRLQLQLMRLAGVDGIILNWYGVRRPALLAASDAIVNETAAAGMRWTLCYEDRTVDDTASAHVQAQQLRDDWQYIRERYMGSAAGTTLLRDGPNGTTGRPLFLVFGPTILLTASNWSTMIDELFPTAVGRPVLLGVDTASPEPPLPDGAFLWPGWRLFDNPGATEQRVVEWATRFYDTADARGYTTLVGGAFPRFRDAYAEGTAGWNGTYTPTAERWWRQHVEAHGGRTLTATLRLAQARHAHAVQVVTWNDWREGTVMEPSAEEGFTQLLRLQEYLLTRREEPRMVAAVRAYNALKADTWHRCDNAPVEARRDCGHVHSTQTSCELSGCCWRETSVAGRPWCFHRASAPVCTCRHDLRNCSATPQDRLCCCTHGLPT